MPNTVCVYCGSSNTCDPVYLDSAYKLGELLAENGFRIVCGGGSIGLMGRLSEGALHRRGHVTGIIPRFMLDNGWGHTALSELIVTETIHERKRKMIELSDVFAALPGGCGTYEELFETITWKQLGLHEKPVFALNINGYFELLKKLLQQSIRDNFMYRSDIELVKFINTPEEFLSTIRDISRM